MKKTKNIVIIADGTGRTAKRLMDAVLAQYSEQKTGFSVENIYQEVRTKRRANEILKEISDDYLVLFSIISADLREHFHNRLEERGVLHLDVLEPMLNTMSKFLGVHPDYKPGLLQRIDDNYYHKVDAIGYTVEHDDGCGYRLPEADLVLVGLSRTCKTPISMYITCNYGLKVANIPIIPDEMIIKQLIERLAVVDPQIIFGLFMQPEALSRVRQNRIDLLSNEKTEKEKLQSYHDPEEIREEVRLCRRLFNQHGWESIDITRRAIEEVSKEIVRSLKRD